MSSKKHRTTDDAAPVAVADKVVREQSRPHLAADADERRRFPRVLVDLEVDYGDKDNFLFASIKDISATGIFVHTEAPESPGTRLNLRFTPTGHADILELEGEVIWINAFRPDDQNNLNPGMGIRFVGLTNDQRHRLVEFIRTFAYLDDE